MKKIYLAALTLAMTACVSNDDLNPVDNYGYIDVNVSNDPVMVTRAEGENTDDKVVDNLEEWYITTKQGEQDEIVWNAQKSYPAGDYTVIARSAQTMEAANTQNTFGIAYYEGSNSVTVNTGGTAQATISCGTAKNSRLKLDLTELNTSIFTNVTLSAKATNEQSSRNLTSKNSIAYYTPESTVNYTITYNYNGAESTTTVPTTNNYSIKIGAAATESTIKLKSNNNGTIEIIKITYNDEFTSSEPEVKEFDAATGEQVTEQ